MRKCRGRFATGAMALFSYPRKKKPEPPRFVQTVRCGPLPTTTVNIDLGRIELRLGPFRLRVHARTLPAEKLGTEDAVEPPAVDSC